MLSRRYALIIPALDEAESLGELLRQIPRDLFAQILVVDNGSKDGTAEVARQADAQVVSEPRRGYGSACLAGLAAIHPSTTAVAFIDADLSDDPLDLTRLVRRFERDGLDLAIGSRVLGNHEPGALAPLQRFGNWLTTTLIRWIWNVSFTDLGPLRMIRREALERLKMSDCTYGWTVEMQARTAQLGLKVAEIPAHYRRRHAGKSKVSGSIVGSVRAGFKILFTVYRCWRSNPKKRETAEAMRA
jgi:glycosyltransferase involved in cell wall biosynthesis